jgi:transcriptional regulator with XRE-family HTH domain
MLGPMERTFAELIRSYRKKNDISVAEMARKCGVSSQYIYSVEYGSDPSVTRADQMLRAIGMSLELGDGPSLPAELKKRRMRAS